MLLSISITDVKFYVITFFTAVQDGCGVKIHFNFCPISFLYAFKMFLAVILKSNRIKLVVPGAWCQRIEKDLAVIFHSTDKNAVPTFENVRQNFHHKDNRCYYGYVLRECRKFFIYLFFRSKKPKIHRTRFGFLASEAEAIEYIRKKRSVVPVNYMAKKSKVNSDELPLNVSSDDDIFVVLDSDGEEHDNPPDLNIVPANENTFVGPEIADNESEINDAATNSIIRLGSENVATQTAASISSSDNCTQTNFTEVMIAQTQTDAAVSNSMIRSSDIETAIYNAALTNAVQCKLEKSLSSARETIKNLNDRLGSETISDSEEYDEDEYENGNDSDTFSDIEEDKKQFDGQFAQNYGFVTNVSKIPFGIRVKKSIHLFFVFQTNGDRLYLNGRIKILAADLKMLKKWNDSFPASSSVNDSKFVCKLLEIVFDRETLMRSSATGRLANNNGLQHEALNVERLQFVKGMGVILVWICAIIICSYSYIFNRSIRRASPQRPTTLQALCAFGEQKML